jgi:dihydropyrimidinase
MVVGAATYQPSKNDYEADVRTLIKNGTVVNSNLSMKYDVLIENEKIVGMFQPGKFVDFDSSKTKIIDAQGLHVLPGGVDPHCHVGFTSGQFTSLDNYEQATRAAVCGGTTTIVDFAIPEKNETPLTALFRQKKRIKDSFCDSAMHGCIINFQDDISNLIMEFEAHGIKTIKMFTTYSGEVMANFETIMEVMKGLLQVGGMVYVHCEADHIISENQFVAIAKNQLDSSFHHRTRSELAEVISVSELLAIAKTVGAPVYFVHQSCREAVDQVALSKSRGNLSFSEAVLHHLVLNESVYDSQYPERFVCCPPMRSQATVDSLIGALRNGDIDTLGSDHCCYSTMQKELIKHDVRYVPAGLPGVETRIPVGLSKLVIEGGLPIERFVAISSTNPAKLNGLFPRKGVIAPGADADIVLWDLDFDSTITIDNLHMATDYTPYEDMRIKVKHIATYVRGTLVAQNSQPIEENKIGKFIAASELNLDIK